MTIHKIPCQDGLCLVRVDDDAKEPFAVKCFSNEVNAKMAIELLQIVSREYGHGEPIIVTDKTA